MGIEEAIIDFFDITFERFIALKKYLAANYIKTTQNMVIPLNLI